MKYPVKAMPELQKTEKGPKQDAAAATAPARALKEVAGGLDAAAQPLKMRPKSTEFHAITVDPVSSVERIEAAPALRDSPSSVLTGIL